MNIFALFALINAFTSGIITTLVLSRPRREPGVLGFAVFSLTAAAWSAAYVIWQLAGDAPMALLWVRILMAPAILIPCGFFHFVSSDLGPPRRRVVAAVYLVGVAFVALDATRFFVAGVAPKLGFPFWPVPGSAFAPFLVLWFGLFAYSTILLARGLRTRSTFERGQLLAVLIGVVVGLLGGATNFLLWFDIPVAPWGNALVSVYVIATGYAIIRHHLFNVRVISVHLVVFTLWTLFLGRILVGPAHAGPVLDWTLFSVVVILGLLLIRQVIRTIGQQAEVERLLAQRKEFLDVAAHQLRSPVTDIVAAASVLAEGEGLRKLGRQEGVLLRGVYDKSRQLAALINDFLDASALDTGDAPYDLGPLEDVDLVELLRRLADDLKPKAKRKRLYLNVELPSQPVVIRSSPARLEQALRNLVDNAIRYTEQGGVTVRLTSTLLDALVEVSDTGIGIPAEFLPRLFQKFARADNARGLVHDGSGLGLFIAKRIVEAHRGGSLLVESVPAKGTTFSARFRCVATDSIAVA